MLKNDKDDERDNKRIKLDESISSNNNSSSSSAIVVDNNERLFSSQADNNDRLFRLVWRNKFLRNKILYYSKSTWRSILLPKYNSSNEINNEKYDEDITIGFKKTNGFNYDQINKVSKMIDRGDHLWLLKLKVSRGDPLNFSLKKNDDSYNECVNDFIQIYRAIKDDIQFYKDLFKNYSKYFECKWNNSNSSNSNKEVNYIIKCDCLAALQVLVEDLKLLDEETGIKHYLYAINNGSINCAKYLLSIFNFKLNKSQIDKLLRSILDIYEKDEHEDERDENYQRCLGISKEQQIKEFGFSFYIDQDAKENGYTYNGQENIEEYKQVRKNQTILFLKSRIDQDLAKEDDFKIEFKLKNSTTLSTMNYQIHDKPLKFIIESCRAIIFIVSLLPSSSFTFTKEVLDAIHKNPWKLVLSNDQIDEIKESLFTNDELNSIISDFSNSHAKIETIKHLLGFIISFGCFNDFNIKFYNAKFNKTFTLFSPNDFEFDINTKLIISAGFANYKQFSSVSNYYYLSRKNFGPYANKHLFKFCKNDMFLKIEFIKDFVQDIIKYGQINGSYSAIDIYVDVDIIELSIFRIILVFLLQDGNIELLSLFINEMVKKSKDKGESFFTEFSSVFGHIQSIEIFDLFYKNQHIKNCCIDIINETYN